LRGVCSQDCARAEAPIPEFLLFRGVQNGATDYLNFEEVKNLSCEILNFAILHECDWNTKDASVRWAIVQLSPAPR